MDEQPIINQEQEKKEPNQEDIVKYIEGLEFYSNPVRFNAIMYQGFMLIIEKLTNIENSLNKNGNN